MVNRQQMTPNFKIIEFKYAHPITGARFWIEWEVEKEREEEYDKVEVVEVDEIIELSGWETFWGLFPKKETIRVKRAITVKATRKVKYMDWEIFSDPASIEVNTGYKTMIEATHVIDRYRVNMTPIVHNY